MSNKWDLRFLDLAKFISSWSKDPSTKCGAVIVRPNKSILSVGFNGFPQSMYDHIFLYDNRDTKYSRIIHAEINALIFANESINGCTLYTWPFACCDRCTVQMIQAGISRFVFPVLPHNLKERWQDSLNKSKSYMSESGAIFTEVIGRNDILTQIFDDEYMTLCHFPFVQDDWCNLPTGHKGEHAHG